MTAEGKLRSHMVWQHNGLRGGISLAIKVLESIMASRSTTAESKDWAFSLLPLMRKLLETLQVRSDHNRQTAA